MEEREEETHARLMRLMRTIVEPCIAGHEGRIVKHAGDGFLAAFDIPVAPGNGMIRNPGDRLSELADSGVGRAGVG